MNEIKCQDIFDLYKQFKQAPSEALAWKIVEGFDIACDRLRLFELCSQQLNNILENKKAAYRRTKKILDQIYKAREIVIEVLHFLTSKQ